MSLADLGEPQATLADVMPAAAAMLGVEGHTSTLDLSGLQPVDAVAVLLIDGLGWWPWRENLDLTPTLAAMSPSRLRTSVPSTTPTALASLGTGLHTGGHGIVGAAFRVAESDHLLHPLAWGDEPHPIAIQPEPTVLERVSRSGVPVVSIGPSAYAGSGLTRAALRGGGYVDADSESAMVAALSAHTTGLAYAYVADLDRTGHVHGVDSREWRQCLADVDRLVSHILERLGPRRRLLVTADHGMVDCPPEFRVDMDRLPLLDDVHTTAGEPRMRHVYVREGLEARVRAAWQDALGDRASVLTREEFIGTGLLGSVEPDYAQRLGDIVVLARGRTILTSRIDPLVSSLLGQHGSVSDEEMHIPLLMSEGQGRG